MSHENFDLLSVLLRRWKIIALCGTLGAAFAAVYGLVAPRWYEARLTVVPSQRSQDSAMSLAARLPAIGGLESLSTDVQRIQAVMTSNSVADEVITRFNLKARYATDHIEEARRTLWEHCSPAADRKSGVVTLTCEDKDPRIAMEMASYFGEVGNRVFGRISASSAREERRFLEGQVVKARNDVDQASLRLRQFQEKHKLVDLPEQSKAAISAMASIQGDLLSKQLQLSYLTSFSSRTESSVAQLQQQITILENKLRQLEGAQLVRPTPPAHGSADPAFFPEAMRVPALRFELEQLFREQKIQETVFFLMVQRYEMTKVDEARDTSTFQILDHPTLPTLRARPRRTRIAILSLFGGLAAGTTLIVLPVWWRRRRTLVPEA